MKCLCYLGMSDVANIAFNTCCLTQGPISGIIRMVRQESFQFEDLIGFPTQSIRKAMLSHRYRRRHCIAATTVSEFAADIFRIYIRFGLLGVSSSISRSKYLCLRAAILCTYINSQPNLMVLDNPSRLTTNGNK